MRRLKDKSVLAWLYMMRVTDKLHRLEGDNLAKYNLTPAQFGVLAHLSADDGITQQELSDMLFVTKGNVCGLIGRLEERGLVVRVNDPEDRRSNHQQQGAVEGGGPDEGGQLRPYFSDVLLG